MKIQKIVDTLEQWSPTQQAEDFDNVGLIVGDVNDDLTGAIICLDTTEKIIDEAL